MNKEDSFTDRVMSRALQVLPPLLERASALVDATAREADVSAAMREELFELLYTAFCEGHREGRAEAYANVIEELAQQGIQLGIHFGELPGTG
jgi:hypothetical protein